MSKKTRVVLLVAAVVLLGAGFAVWRVYAERHDEIAGGLPRTPDLSTVATEMSDRVQEAEAQTRSLFHARSGLVELSRIYHANGFLDEAAQCYAILERIEPNEPRWQHLHASILSGYGEVEDAQEHWERAVQLAPKYVPARLRLGDSYLKANQPTKAVAAYTAVLGLDPKNAYALLGLARIDFEARRWDQARERLEAVVQQTNYQLGYDLIVTLYEQIGERDRATAIRGAAKASGAYRDPVDPWLDELAAACYDPYRLSLSAGLAARNDDPAEAIRLLERAIELAPNDVAVRFQLGSLAVQQKNSEIAREQLERCTVLAPDFADGWAWLSSLYSQTGDATAAERALATGLKNCPQSPGLRLMRARKYREAKRFPEAESQFLLSINLRPNEPDAYIELANMYIGQGRTEDGVGMLQRALVAEPGNPTAMSTLAFHAITTGNEAESRAWLQRIRNQPRVTRDMAMRLQSAYKQTFGRDFVPARGG